ncbi:hypothetical protein CLOM_g17963 [Closterium sp. NIES-68]|nr:hypothetical protein CLOM_g17963 [Closterium sp. NIES-68]
MIQLAADRRQQRAPDPTYRSYLGPSRDEPRVFGLDKFNGDNFAEWSFKMENIFDHYDLLEVMEGTEKRPENDPEKSPAEEQGEEEAEVMEAVVVVEAKRQA